MMNVAFSKGLMLKEIILVFITFNEKTVQNLKFQRTINLLGQIKFAVGGSNCKRCNGIY